MSNFHFSMGIKLTQFITARETLTEILSTNAPKNGSCFQMEEIRKSYMND